MQTQCQRSEFFNGAEAVRTERQFPPEIAKPIIPFHDSHRQCHLASKDADIQELQRSSP